MDFFLACAGIAVIIVAVKTRITISSGINRDKSNDPL